MKNAIAIFIFCALNAAAQPPPKSEGPPAEIDAIKRAIPKESAKQIESITPDGDGAYMVKMRVSASECFALRFHIVAAKKGVAAIPDAREYSCDK